MIMIVGTFRLPAENMDTAQAAMTRVVNETRKEEGCLDFAFSENVSDPGLIHLAERWADRAALEAHWQSPHLKEFRPIGQQLGFGERNIFLYEIASQTQL